MSINDNDDNLILLEHITSSWEASYKVGPVEIKLNGTTDPLVINFDAYFLGIKFASGVIDLDGREKCVTGKINSTTKVELCLKLLDNNTDIEIKVKVCIFGKCTEYKTTISIPVSV